jgi:hypothetical protein
MRPRFHCCEHRTTSASKAGRHAHGTPMQLGAWGIWASKAKLWHLSGRLKQATCRAPLALKRSALEGSGLSGQSARKHTQSRAGRAGRQELAGGQASRQAGRRQAGGRGGARADRQRKWSRQTGRRGSQAGASRKAGRREQSRQAGNNIEYLSYWEKNSYLYLTSNLPERSRNKHNPGRHPHLPLNLACARA